MSGTIQLKPLGFYIVRKLQEPRHALEAALTIQLDLARTGTYRPIGEIMVEKGWLGRDMLEQCLRGQREEAISGMDLFNALPPETLSALARNSRHVIYHEHSTIVEQSAPGDYYYIILHGRVLVVRRSETGDDIPLATLGPGEGFGEIALLTGQPRLATVRALERTSLISISKEAFDQVVNSAPWVSQAFIRVLAERLSRGNTSLVQTFYHEKAYRQFITEQMNRHEPVLAGSSPAVRSLLDDIKSTSENSRPAIITGEPGSEVWDVCGLIHKERNGDDEGLLSMDAKTASIVSAGRDREEQDTFHREVAQLSALFGRSQNYLPFAPEMRPGLLQLVGSGTAIIENIECLAPGAQTLLKEFIKKGSFQPLGGEVSLSSSAKILATTHENLKVMVDVGGFDKELYELLAEQTICIPPLRKRKKDMKEIITHLMERSGKLTSKVVKGIDEEAYKAIMAYDWPGNMEELYGVVRRAVSLARGEYLALEDIFIGPPPVSGTLSFNMFRFSKVRDMLRSRTISVAFQLTAGPFIALIIVLGFLGSQSPTRNVALILVWGFWEPLVVISSFVGTRIWCKICPIGACSELLAKTAGLKRQVPLFIRKYGFYLSAFGLATIFWSESASGMPTSPTATAFLLVTIVGLAIITGLLFQRRTWCRYLCPMGGMVGVLSTCSPIELRSNYSICTNNCAKHECYAGNKTTEGCPMFEGPFSLHSNQNCILCGKCIEICPNNSPVLNLRPPAQELWTSRKMERNTVALGLVLIGTQIFRGLENIGIFRTIEIEGTQFWLYSCLYLTGVIAILFLLTGAAGKRIFPAAKNEEGSNTHLLIYALLPLAVAYEISFQTERLLSMGPQFLSVLGRQLQLGFELPGTSVSAGLIKFLQGCLVLLGLAGSLMVLKRLVSRHVSPPVSSGIGFWRSWPSLLIGGAYLIFFVMK
jgi:transcriptional regulator with AAA-type ATPase domain/NAD-dependent dihydropyrimidine dehydrogenase PreA subunit